MRTTTNYVVLISLSLSLSVGEIKIKISYYNRLTVVPPTRPMISSGEVLIVQIELESIVIALLYRD